MIIVCGTETSTIIRWSPNVVPLPCFAECGCGGCNGHVNRDQVHGDSSNFQISLLAHLISSQSPHSATQWGEECSGVNAVPLVSVLQTRSSRMIVCFLIIHIIYPAKSLIRIMVPILMWPQITKVGLYCIWNTTSWLLKDNDCYCITINYTGYSLCT